jgi:hypothetical protein
MDLALVTMVTHHMHKLDHHLQVTTSTLHARLSLRSTLYTMHRLALPTWASAAVLHCALTSVCALLFCKCSFHSDVAVPCAQQQRHLRHAL